MSISLCLIKHGADISSLDHSGVTPIQICPEAFRCDWRFCESKFLPFQSENLTKTSLTVFILPHSIVVILLSCYLDRQQIQQASTALKEGFANNPKAGSDLIQRTKLVQQDDHGTICHKYSLLSLLSESTSVQTWKAINTTTKTCVVAKIWLSYFTIFFDSKLTCLLFGKQQQQK